MHLQLCPKFPRLPVSIGFLHHVDLVLEPLLGVERHPVVLPVIFLGGEALKLVFYQSSVTTDLRFQVTLLCLPIDLYKYTVMLPVADIHNMLSHGSQIAQQHPLLTVQPLFLCTCIKVQIKPMHPVFLLQLSNIDCIDMYSLSYPLSAAPCVTFPTGSCCDSANLPAALPVALRTCALD